MKNIAGLVLGIVCCSQAAAATLYVDLNSAAPAAPFDSWASAATNIQDAVNASVDGDIIRIADGHYLLASQISVTNAIAIQSVNGPESVRVDGQGSVRCFNLGNTACVLEGLTITNGYTTSDGGGIYCNGTIPLITNCTISGNSAADWLTSKGGGMYGGTANNCTISGNSAFGFSGGGGGMYGSTANNCTISGNSSFGSVWGGGGGMHGGTANNCTISGNSAIDEEEEEAYGGGMSGGTANNCIISGNSANFGGGMAYSTANNCIISDNSAVGFWGDVGGMYSCTANNCTVIGNSADGLFAGNIGGMNHGSAKNCIVWHNESLIPGYSPNLYNVTVHNTCSPDVTHAVDGNITNAPGFVDYGNGDYRLMSNSPCINMGDNAYVVGEEDLNGLQRMVGGHVDMGAYEFQSVGWVDLDEDGLPDDWEWSYFASFSQVADGNADGDGHNNGDEYIAGTDPSDPASVFALSNAYPAAAGFVVEWKAVTGRWYTVRWQPSLTNTTEVLQDYLEYPQNSYTDTVHDAESTGFYQAEVRMK